MPSLLYKTFVAVPIPLNLNIIVHFFAMPILVSKNVRNQRTIYKIIYLGRYTMTYYSLVKILISEHR